MKHYLTASNIIICFKLDNVNGSKRTRAELSPEESGCAKKQQIEENKEQNNNIGDKNMLSQIRELFADFEQKMDQKLSLLALKQDLQQYIEEVAEMRKQNEELKRMVIYLNECREKDKKQLEQVQITLRSKNLIFKDIKEEADVDIGVRKILGDILHVKAVPVNTVRLYQRNGKATVKVEFGSSQDVQEVLRNTRKLKGTLIGVDRDLPESVRAVRGELLKIRKQILGKIVELDPKNRKKIIVMNEKMKIDDDIFTIDRGVLMCGKENGIKKLNSIFKLDFLDISINVNKLNDVYSNEIK